MRLFQLSMTIRVVCFKAGVAAAAYSCCGCCVLRVVSMYIRSYRLFTLEQGGAASCMRALLAAADRQSLGGR
jgi:hypothetical protein